MTSTELVADLVCLGGDLDHLPADLEERSQFVDAAGLLDRIPQKVTRYEQLASEGVGFALLLPIRAVNGMEMVVPELVCDREALATVRLRGDNLDASADQTGAETSKVNDLDDVEPHPSSDGMDRDRRLGDVVFEEDTPGFVTSMRRMGYLLTCRTTRYSEQFRRQRVLVAVDRHRRSTTLRTLILEAGSCRKASPALLVGAAQIRHGNTEPDYTALHVPLIGARRNPVAAIISPCCRRFGDARRVEGATMDRKERKVFAEVDRLRDDQGLGEKLDRYRQARDQYERLFKGRKETGPAPALTPQRSQRQTSARGRIRGIVDRNP